MFISPVVVYFFLELNFFLLIILSNLIQGISRVIMTPTELKMQPTIHLEGKAAYLSRRYPALRSKCIVGCIFNSVGLIITREIPCICSKYLIKLKGYTI
jgi:hypothetical protein